MPTLLTIMASMMHFVSALAKADTLQVLRTSAIIGFCSHIAVSRPSLEFEQYMISCLIVASILHVSGITLIITFGDQSIACTLYQTILLWTGFVIGFLTSLSIYRLYLHRCRKFPGPLMAKLTRFYAVYLNAKDAQYYQELGKLHEEYGDYLRIGILLIKFTISTIN